MANTHNQSAITHSVLFVCTANQCRSPMAMVLFNALARSKGFILDEWVIASAGCQAFPGLSASSIAQYVMQERQIDLTHHRSQIVTHQLLNDHFLILCMGRDHKSYLQSHFPSLANRVYLLSEMDGREIDIEDPVGYPPPSYRETADLMLEYMTKGFDKICRLSSIP